MKNELFTELLGRTIIENQTGLSVGEPIRFPTYVHDDLVYTVHVAARPLVPGDRIGTFVTIGAAGDPCTHCGGSGIEPGTGT